jgi:hypothetical protein
MEAWKVCRPVVADSHPLDEVKDPVPHSSEKLDPDQDPHLSDADPKPTVDILLKRFLGYVRVYVPYLYQTYNLVLD